MISSFLHLSRNPEIEIEDTLSLDDLTSYLNPGAQDYINEDLAQINRSILEKTPNGMCSRIDPPHQIKYSRESSSYQRPLPLSYSSSTKTLDPGFLNDPITDPSRPCL
ncbi:Uncharacterized protein FKW44_005130 [Caligus rogercresseyi]|uniref:Uncharacterized protein n=1 Tax=Caligus rogercresseyi TaxID=217165 RepID=A0A7T8KBJ5_CALRO|nr:Uncharacterized protein FKW44_005130 [Caligus rogercresseyi]